MKLKLLALLTIILLLASMSCKKKDDDTSPTAPKTTLAERAGTYTCIDVLGTAPNQTITITSAGLITVDTFSKQFDPTSTETSFIITTANNKDVYRVEFDTKKLIGLNIGNDNNTYNFTKN